MMSIQERVVAAVVVCVCLCGCSKSYVDAVKLYKAGHYEKSVRVLDRLPGEEKNAANAKRLRSACRLKQAEAAVAKGDRDGGCRFLAEVDPLAGGQAETEKLRKRIAMAQHRAGQFEQCLATIERLSAESREQPKARYLRNDCRFRQAKAALLRSDPAGSVNLLRAIDETFPGYAGVEELFRKCIMAQYHAGQYEQALASLEGAPRKVKGSERGMYLRNDCLLRVAEAALDRGLPRRCMEILARTDERFQDDAKVEALREKARASEEEAEWRKASAVGDCRTLRAYVESHPQGVFTAAAESRLAAMLADETPYKAALAKGSEEGLRSFLEEYPGHARSADAQKAMGNLQEARAWETALGQGSCRALKAFAQAYPQGPFAGEAALRLAAMLADETPYKAALAKGSEEGLRSFLEEYPGHARSADAQSAIRDLQGRDIVDLLKEGKLEVQTSGSGIQSVSIKVRRLVKYPVALRIPVGTFFVSSRVSAQNMVGTAEVKQTLRDDEWHSISVSAACANRPRDIPGGTDTFTLQRTPDQADLEAVVSCLDKAGASYDVRQAAVWIITDNADYGDLGILVSRSPYTPPGFGGARVIDEDDAVRAMKLCEEAGVAIRKKAIWRDRETLLRGLRNPDLKKWLEGQE